MGDALDDVFGKYESQIYPYRFAVTVLARNIAGGTPSDPKIVEGWLRSKTAESDDLIRKAVAEVLAERGVTTATSLDVDEAVKEVATRQHLNGFKRDALTGELFIEGRQVKSAIKEAANVAGAAGNLPTGKGAGKDFGATTGLGLKSTIAEHIFVVEDRIGLGVTEPSRVVQQFVHKTGPNGPTTAIQYSEVVDEAKMTFTVESDIDIPEAMWGALWVTGKRQGLGAGRSQGYGTYRVVGWDPVPSAS